MDHRQTNHVWGPWYQLAGSYAEPLAGENPETYGVPIANLHADHVAADNLRRVNYAYAAAQLLPPSRVPGFIFHQAERTDDNGTDACFGGVPWRDARAGRGPARATLRPGGGESSGRCYDVNARDFDYVGYKYSLLASVGSGGLNNVVAFLPGRDAADAARARAMPVAPGAVAPPAFAGGWFNATVAVPAAVAAQLAPLGAYDAAWRPGRSSARLFTFAVVGPCLDLVLELSTGGACKEMDPIISNLNSLNLAAAAMASEDKKVDKTSASDDENDVVAGVAGVAAVAAVEREASAPWADVAGVAAVAAVEREASAPWADAKLVAADRDATRTALRALAPGADRAAFARALAARGTLAKADELALLACRHPPPKKARGARVPLRERLGQLRAAAADRPGGR
ncbi:hypothetical protein SO694_0004003 [Aureococcus anophagefferens]|uniref:Sialate O-acetylesterase domain-containing protein n=1 Tax=Aureococcus anophagefferens TaxID=44056 RepID=A0ABR1G688_AURAN